MHTMPPLRPVQINRLVLETRKQWSALASAVESKFTRRDDRNISGQEDLLK